MSGHQATSAVRAAEVENAQCLVEHLLQLLEGGPHLPQVSGEVARLELRRLQALPGTTEPREVTLGPVPFLS